MFVSHVTSSSASMEPQNENTDGQIKCMVNWSKQRDQGIGGGCVGIVLPANMVVKNIES